MGLQFHLNIVRYIWPFLQFWIEMVSENIEGCCQEEFLQFSFVLILGEMLFSPALCPRLGQGNPEPRNGATGKASWTLWMWLQEKYKWCQVFESIEVCCQRRIPCFPLSSSSANCCRLRHCSFAEDAYRGILSPAIKTLLITRLLNFQNYNQCLRGKSQESLLDGALEMYLS